MQAPTASAAAWSSSLASAGDHSQQQQHQQQHQQMGEQAQYFHYQQQQQQQYAQYSQQQHSQAHQPQQIPQQQQPQGMPPPGVPAHLAVPPVSSTAAYPAQHPQQGFAQQSQQQPQQLQPQQLQPQQQEAQVQYQQQHHPHEQYAQQQQAYDQYHEQYHPQQQHAYDPQQQQQQPYAENKQEPSAHVASHAEPSGRHSPHQRRQQHTAHESQFVDRRRRSPSREHSRDRTRGDTYRRGPPMNRDQRRTRSRSRSRSRERARDWSRDRERDQREHSRGSYDRRRERSHDRDRRYSSDRRSPSPRRMRSRDRGYDDDDRDFDRRRRRRRRYDSDDEPGHRSRGPVRSRSPPSPRARRRPQRHSSPSHIAMLKNLPFDATREDVWAALTQLGAQLKDVRIIVDKATGEPRGFGFAEFASVDACARFVEDDRLRLEINGRPVHLDYSHPKPDERQPASDWLCTFCGEQNFARRVACFRCQRDKDPNARDVPATDLKNTQPGPVLIVRGLTKRTTDEMVYSAFAVVQPPLAVRLVRDRFTSESRGFAFLDYSSPEEATSVLNRIQESPVPFLIDNVQVRLSFAKEDRQHPQTSQSHTANAAIQAAMAQRASLYGGDPTGHTLSAQPQPVATPSSAHTNPASTAPTTTTPASSAAAVTATTAPATTPTRPAVVQQAATADTAAPSTSTTASAPTATATAAATTAMVTAATTTAAAPATTQQGASLSAPPSNPLERLQMDPHSGYAYDPVSGYYYDQSSGYFYDSSTGVYYVFDTATQAFVAAAAAGGAAAGSKEKDKEKKRKKQAKKVAHDLEKWQRQQESAAAKGGPAKPIAELRIKRMPATKEEEEALRAPSAERAAGPQGQQQENNNDDDGNGASDTKPEGQEGSQQPPQQTGKKPAGKTDLHALLRKLPPTQGSPNDWETMQARSLVDLDKVACLVCKRQLDTVEKLEKHVRLSKLHKEKVVKARSKLFNKLSEGERETLERLESKPMYRDRARERRQKYGQPERPADAMTGRPAFQQSGFEQPTLNGIGSDNIGNQLLKKMGWKAGEGLGSRKQGIVDPVQAEIRTRNAGLGSGTVMKVDSMPTTYKGIVRQKAKERYRRIEREEGDTHE